MSRESSAVRWSRSRYRRSYCWDSFCSLESQSSKTPVVVPNRIECSCVPATRLLVVVIVPSICSSPDSGFHVRTAGPQGRIHNPGVIFQNGDAVHIPSVTLRGCRTSTRAHVPAINAAILRTHEYPTARWIECDWNVGEKLAVPGKPSHQFPRPRIPESWPMSGRDNHRPVGAERSFIS
jgi:hypothetical protein